MDRTERPGNYAEHASTYDRTRRASPSLAAVLTRRLGPGAGRRLLDVAGGTGNYTQVARAAGFEPVMVDVSPEMLALSVAKVGQGRQVVGDAMAMPFADSAFDCAMLTQAVHLMKDWPRLLREVHRVIREGPFVLQAYTAENLEHVFVFDLFPGSTPDAGQHPSRTDVERSLREAGFGRVEAETYVYTDQFDANLHTLHTDARLIADPEHLRNTSWFHRMPPESQKEGLARLAEELSTGALEERVAASNAVAARTGHGTVFVATP